MIKLEQVRIEQGEFRLANINMQIEAGEYAVLMGSSGSGKTSIIECICGLRSVSDGKIVLGDRDITNLAPGARGIGYVPQDVALFPGMTVRNQIAFSLTLRKMENEAIDKRVNELAQLLEITALLDREPLHLSGGESQRVGLARALAPKPDVLVLDEPLSALDSHLHNDICDMLKKTHESTGVSVLHITHNQAEADRLGQRFFVLADGKLEEQQATS